MPVMDTAHSRPGLNIFVKKISPSTSWPVKFLPRGASTPGPLKLKAESPPGFCSDK